MIAGNAITVMVHWSLVEDEELDVGARRVGMADELKIIWEAWHRLSRLTAPFSFTFIYSNKKNPNLAKTDSVSWLEFT
jgi:hypothetical protein